jgi:hypothetical protein
MTDREMAAAVGRQSVGKLEMVALPSGVWKRESGHWRRLDGDAESAS